MLLKIGEWARQTGHRLRCKLSTRSTLSVIGFVVLTIFPTTGALKAFMDHKLAGAAPLSQMQPEKDQSYRVAVGLNTKFLKDQYIAVYDDCEPALKIGDLVLLTNDNHALRPSVLLEVDKVIRRGKDQSAGSIFVSRKATDCLQIFKKNPGVVKLTMRKVGQQSTTSSGKPVLFSIPISFSLVKK